MYHHIPTGTSTPNLPAAVVRAYLDGARRIDVPLANGHTLVIMQELKPAFYLSIKDESHGNQLASFTSDLSPSPQQLETVCSHFVTAFNLINK